MSLRTLGITLAFTLTESAGVSIGLAQSPAPGDGGPAAAARFVAPGEIILDRGGNLYVSERAGYRVRRIDARTGIVTTVAGTDKGYGGDGGPAVAARFDQLSGMAVDSVGNLFIGDLWNSRIRKVDARSGLVTTVVGTGTAGYSGDGGPAARAQITAAFDLGFDRQGNLIFTDTENHRIRRVDARTDIITTIAGNGRWGFSGDEGPATEASFARPHCVLLTPENDLIICDSFNQRIRRVDARTGIVTTIAGTGLFGGAGDNGPATRASITYVGDMVLDTAGALLFSDIATHRIRRVDRRTGIITTIAGTGAPRFAGDGGPAVEGSFDLPAGLVFDSTGSLLIADMWNGRIRKIDSRSGRLSTVAGSALSPETPDWRFRVTYDGGAVRALTNRPPALQLPDAGRVTLTELTYPRTGEGLPGVMSVFVPASLAPAERRPVVLIVHGRTNQEVRPRESGGLMAWARLLAASGVVAILPDQRLGASAVSAEHAHEDLRSALATVSAQSARLHADVTRVCLLTFSDGVAPAVALLAEAATRPRCLVAFYPTVNLDDRRLFAWTLEPALVRERMALLGAATSRTYRAPTFIARAGGDRPEVNEPLARLEQQTAGIGGLVTVVSHPSGQSGFERLLHDDDSARIIRQAIDFLIMHLR